MKIKLILQNIAGSTDLDDISNEYMDQSKLETCMKSENFVRRY